MRRFKTDLILKYFKIIPLIIFIFSNSIALGATVTFVQELVIPDNDWWWTITAFRCGI